MKNLYPSLAFLTLALAHASCTEEPEPIQKNVRIGFTVLSETDVITSLPEDSRLVVNLQTQNGEAVIDDEEVRFRPGENRFYSAPLDLDFGNFQITDFMIVDQQDNILYAAPKEGATLATRVDHPLDYRFELSPASRGASPILRLLDVRKHDPRDFGYASFRRPRRDLSVVATLQDQLRPASAKAFILLNRDTIRTYDLRPKVNRITLPEAMNEDYRFVVAKAGYASVRYTLSELLATHRNKPVKAILNPAFTLKAFVDEGSLMFDCYLGGPDGTSITVDWGDETTTSYDLVPLEVNVTHAYAQSGNYPITITGALETITSFYSFYGQGMFDAADFRHLRDLKEIRFGLSRSPVTLDLSHNTKLTSAMLVGLPNLRVLHLPKEHQLTYLGLDGPNHMSIENLDAVILNVYQNTVNKNLRNGLFEVAATWLREDDSLLGPPSAAGLNNLRTMQQSYGWTISPDPFN